MYKLLIADDEQIERNALKAIINKSIDEIIIIQEAINGREAIVKSRTFQPDIIFLDIKMPGIDGIEAAKIIKEDSPQTSIVFLTAFNQFDYAQEAIQIGVDDFIIKPSSESRVLDVLNKIMMKIRNHRNEENRNKNNEIKLTRVTGYMENEFIFNMAVHGITIEKFNNYLSILDINFFTGRAGIVKLLYETYPIHVESNYQKQVLMKRSAFIIKSIITKNGFKVLFNMDLSNIYFLLIKEKKISVNVNEVDFTLLTKEITKEIKQTLNFSIILGIGSSFKDPLKSLKYFSKVKNLLSNTKDTGRNQSSDSIGTFPLNLEIDMEHEILNGNSEKIQSTIQQLREWFEISELNFEIKKKSIIELATVLRHATAYQLPDGKCLVDETDIKEAANGLHLLSGFNIFINELLGNIASAKEFKNSPAIDSACRFIKLNYKEDITLEETATQCRLSSFYFSKLFKKEKGITFIEYLTNYRIQKAKQLLKNTNLSIKEISGDSGYSDPNYFTKVFRKVVSISPTTYRNNNLPK
jgi:two-component system, response regulator YesN